MFKKRERWLIAGGLVTIVGAWLSVRAIDSWQDFLADRRIVNNAREESTRRKRERLQQAKAQEMAARRVGDKARQLSSRVAVPAPAHAVTMQESTRTAIASYLTELRKIEQKRQTLLQGDGAQIATLWNMAEATSYAGQNARGMTPTGEPVREFAGFAKQTLPAIAPIPAKLQECLNELQGLMPPASCQEFHQAYGAILAAQRDYFQMTVDLTGRAETQAQFVQDRLTALRQEYVNHLSMLDATADQQLGHLCAQAEIPKPFALAP